MNTIKKGLGRGLSSLIGETKVEIKTNKLYVEGNVEPTNVHSSEYAWAKEEFDFVIENNGTKEELCVKTNNLFISNKIPHTPSKPSNTVKSLAIGANSF